MIAVMNFLIISLREHRLFLCSGIGAHAVRVSPATVIPYRYLFPDSSFLTLTSPRSILIEP